MEKVQATDILQQLRDELTKVLKEQMVGLYLYGSHARGDARPDSDWDVLVVVRGEFEYFTLVEQTGEIAARLSLQYDTVISLAFTSAANFNEQNIPFFLNIRQEGIAI